MANEITVNTYLKVAKGNLSEEYRYGQETFDQTNVGGPTPGYITVGTSEESTTFSELTTLGWCFLRNLDTTNYIEVGGSTGVYLIRLEAGENALFRLNPGATMYYKANSAACKMLVAAFED